MYTISWPGYVPLDTFNRGLNVQERPSLLAILPVVWIVRLNLHFSPLLASYSVKKVIALGTILKSHGFSPLMDSF